MPNRGAYRSKFEMSHATSFVALIGWCVHSAGPFKHHAHITKLNLKLGSANQIWTKFCYCIICFLRPIFTEKRFGRLLISDVRMSGTGHQFFPAWYQTKHWPNLHVLLNAISPVNVLVLVLGVSTGVQRHVVSNCSNREAPNQFDISVTAHHTARFARENMIIMKIFYRTCSDYTGEVLHSYWKNKPRTAATSN